MTLFSKRLVSWAPPWMWLFWLIGALVIGVGFVKGGEPQPRFLVATGLALEVWHGAEREAVILRPANGSSILDAALSTDGTQIAFLTLVIPISEQQSDVGVDLYLVNRDGSGPRLLLKHSVYGEFMESPTWLPGGTEIAYTIKTPQADDSVDHRIEVIDVTSGRRRRLLDAADHPAVMPGGDSLIVRVLASEVSGSGEAPALYDLKTGAVSRLPAFSAAFVYIGSFTVSPDGRQVAFGAADPSLVAPRVAPSRGTSVRAALHPVLQDVWLMDLDGSNLRRVADLAVNQPSLAWSADSGFVYAMSPVGFWRIDAKTGAQKKLGPGLQNGRIKLVPGR